MSKTEQGLTAQQETFALGLSKGLSQSEAYREAYPRSRKWKADAVWSSASVLAKDPKVSARVASLREAIAEQTILKTAEILTEIRRLALFDIKDLFDTQGRLLSPHEVAVDARRSIVAFDVDEFGRIKVKSADKLRALEIAARILGLFEKDNQQQAPTVFQTIELVPLQPNQPAAPTAKPKGD